MNEAAGRSEAGRSEARRSEAAGSEAERSEKTKSEEHESEESKTSRFRRMREIFEEAVELPESQRAAYLAEACGDDRELHRRVLALLAADRQTTSPIDRPVSEIAFALLSEQNPDSQSGRRIGAHRLLSQIGRGGMGSIYLAERADGEYREQVAIKLIRPGLGSEALIRRFRQERQILAQLNHPNIGRILDGGVTEDGQPYFVMEHIEGEPIDRYCEQQDLGPDQRIQLFAEVCDAVHEAHRNLVIHCDIKPSNILVTSDGVPKLLDFGIARPAPEDQAIEPAGEPTGEVLPHGKGDPSPSGPGGLTPEYASPEQLHRDSLTTASDTFSLGVVLHELLTGRSPFDSPSQKEHPSLARTTSKVRDQPRQGDSDGANAQGTAPNWDVSEKSGVRTFKTILKAKTLGADLPHILHRALAPIPRDRYGSVREFAEDLRRYLRHLPVQARKPTWTYRTGKLFRRRWATVTLSCLILASATAGLFATLHQAQVAKLRGQQAEQAYDFLVDLFVASDPDEAAGPGDIALVGLLNEAASRTPEEFTEDPLLQARLMDTIGMVYSSLGRYDQADPMLSQALELRENHLSPNHEDVATSLDHLGLLRISQDQLDRAEPHLLRALGIRQDTLGPSHELVAESLHRMGRLRRSQNQMSDSEEFYRQALHLRRQILGIHRDVAVTLNNLGVVLRRQGQVEEAEQLLREAADIFEETLGPEHWRLGNAKSNLGHLLRGLRRHSEAMELYHQALAIQRHHLGSDHPEIGGTLSNLGVVYQLEGRLPEAERNYRESLEILAPRLGENHVRVARVQQNLGAVLVDQAHFEEAEPLLRQAMQVLAEQLPSKAPNIDIIQSELGQVLAGTGRQRQAEEMFRACLERRFLRSASPTSIAVAQTRLGANLIALGQPQEAADLLHEAVRTLVREKGNRDSRTLEARSALETLQNNSSGEKES